MTIIQQLKDKLERTEVLFSQTTDKLLPLRGKQFRNRSSLSVEERRLIATLSAKRDILYEESVRLRIALSVIDELDDIRLD